MSEPGGAADDGRPTGTSGKHSSEIPGMPWTTDPDDAAAPSRPSVVPAPVLAFFSDLRVQIGLGVVAALGVGLLVGGLVFGNQPTTGTGPTVAAPSASSATPTEDPAFEPVATVVDAPRPVTIAIPDLGISQGLIDLTVSPEGKMGVPSEWMDIGWWADGPAPGEAGGALIAGHVNGGGQPAVFAQLPTLAVGAQVTITREDGSTATYAVRTKEEFAKDDFPDARVYTFAGPSYLHLVTCGGQFDTRTGHYEDNIVVFAELVSVSPA